MTPNSPSTARRGSLVAERTSSARISVSMIPRRTSLKSACNLVVAPGLRVGRGLERQHVLAPLGGEELRSSPGGGSLPDGRLLREAIKAEPAQNHTAKARAISSLRPVFGSGEDCSAADKNISDEAVIASILDSLGQSEAWIEASRTPENKTALKKQTERAANLGIFGAPSFVAGGELFWGGDRMEEAFAWESGRRSCP